MEVREGDVVDRHDGDLARPGFGAEREARLDGAPLDAVEKAARPCDGPAAYRNQGSEQEHAEVEASPHRTWFVRPRAGLERPWMLWLKVQ